MKASIITVCLNSEHTIEKSIESVNNQKLKLIEHIFVDGMSQDNTKVLINKTCNTQLKLISGKDEGIYDAMNKGFSVVTGDFVGFLNSDDWYSDQDVLSDVASIFSNPKIDFAFGDAVVYSKSGKVFRYWKSHSICGEYLHGQQIPHPAFFVRTNVLKKLPLPFDPKYKISADLKQQLILINKYRSTGLYIPRPLVNISLGGASTKNFNAYISGWRESVSAYNEVFGKGGFIFTLSKILSKVSGIKFKI